MLELKDCDRELLNDLNYIRETLTRAAKDVGAHIVGESFHQFHPIGVTGVLAISESHICIHTWPELGYAAADVFTCGTSFDPRKAAQILIERLRSKEPTVTELKRGFVSESVPSPLEISS